MARRAAAVGLLAVSTLSAAQPEGGLGMPSVDGYELQAGDFIRVSVWRDDQLDQGVLVRPDGGVSFPLAGDLSEEGKTIDEATQEIAQKLSEFIRNPVVTVSLQENSGNRIYVTGRVNQPGVFLVNRPIDIMQALSMAGGLTPFADRDAIKVLRREGSGQRAIPLNYKDLQKGWALQQNIMLQAGYPGRAMRTFGAAGPVAAGSGFDDLRHVDGRPVFRATLPGLAAACVLLALTTGTASAQQWQARTVANAELRYIDNVRLSVDDPESSFGSSLRAAAHAVRLAENGSLDLAAGLSANTYSEASDLDNPAAFVRIDPRFRGERSRYRLGLSLDTQSTLTSETATTGLTQINKQQYQFAVNPGWNYLLTERASVDVGLSYTEVFYEDVNAIPLFNYRSGNLSAGGGYRLSERGGLDLRVSCGRYMADEVETEYDNWAFQLGANYLLTEAWSLDFLFGLRRTEGRFSDLSGSQFSQESSGPTYTVKLGKRFDPGGGINFQAIRELVPSGMPMSWIRPACRFAWTILSPNVGVSASTRGDTETVSRMALQACPIGGILRERCA